MSDDDLRFGDVEGDSGGSAGSGGVFDLMIRGFVALIFLYVILRTVEILFNIQLPLI